MLFRVNKALTKGSKILRRGSYSNFDWLSDDKKQILLKDNVISELKTPPLEQLPGWKTRAKRLEPFNIKTCADFLETSNEPLASIFKIRIGIIEKYKKEIESYILVEEKIDTR